MNGMALMICNSRSRYVTPVTCTFILFVGATFVVRKHIMVLPYHHVRINMCRGGILLTVWWLACCSFILSVMRMATGITNPQQSPSQIIEWVFISAIIPMYILGNLWVVRRRAAIHKNLNRLRNEWQKSFENRSETIEVKPFEVRPCASQLPSFVLELRRIRSLFLDRVF